MLQRIRNYWFGEVDSRPLSLFRIIFALLILKNVIYFLPLADIFYTDKGLLPRQTLLQISRPTRFSLLDSLSYGWSVWLFFGLWFIVSLGLLTGYRTRLMTILNFLCILSVHERNVYILNGADTVLRILSFWAMFVPLAHYYSIDARRYTPEDTPRTTFALPVRMLQMQFALIYVFAFASKLPGDTWEKGWALHYVGQLHSMLLPTGDWFFAHAPTHLLRSMTIGTMVLEGSFFFLVFSPFWQPHLKIVALVSGFMLHAGVAFIMTIGDFSIVMIGCYSLFFEAQWVEWLMAKIPRKEFFTQFAERFSPPLAPLRPLRREWKVIISLVLIPLMFLVWWQNFHTLTQDDEFTPLVQAPPQEAYSVLQMAGLWQAWDLFAPYPLILDGWIQIPGTFEDGKVIDLRTEASLNNELPRGFTSWAERWRKYEYYGWHSQNPAILNAWASYYCRLYNVDHPRTNRLHTLEIRFRYRQSHEPNVAPNDWQEITIWQHWCYGQPTAPPTISNPKMCEPFCKTEEEQK